MRAALFAIADGGAAAVAVEPLAARLGATKGSFYWHFPNREQLIVEALELWEREGTDDVIAELAPVSDPVERLRRLLEIAIGSERRCRSGGRRPARRRQRSGRRPGAEPDRRQTT